MTHSYLKPNQDELRCSKCHVSFSTVNAKLKHMRLKQAAGVLGHVHCQICGSNFYTSEGVICHMREVHPKSHELECPACLDGPFAKLSQLIAHIEKGGCKRLDAELLDQLRERKMEFTKGLKDMTNEPIKHDFSVYLPSHAYTRARNELAERYDQQTRILAAPGDHVASPQSSTLPPHLRNTAHGWPGLSSPQSSQSSHYSSVDNAVKFTENTTGLANTFDLPLSNMSSNDDMFDSGDTVSKIDGQEENRSVRHSLPPHLAAIQKARESQQASSHSSPWGQVPSVQVQPSSASPWGNSSATLQHRPEPQKPARLPHRAESPWGQTPSVSQLQKQQNTKNPPTMAQKLFPNAPPAQRPTQKQLTAAYTLSEKQKYMLMDPDSPQHPNFNPARYRSQYTGKFVCPKNGCGKCVKTAEGLVAHLKSEAHSDQMYVCPRCLGRFRSLTALTAHLESESTRCNVRDARDFDALVDQVTSGLVDVASGRNDDGTNKYQVNGAAQDRVQELGFGDPSYEEKERSKASPGAGWDDIKPARVDEW